MLFTSKIVLFSSVTNQGILHLSVNPYLKILIETNLETVYINDDKREVSELKTKI